MNRNTFARSRQNKERLQHKPATKKVFILVIPLTPPVLVHPPVKKSCEPAFELTSGYGYWGIKYKRTNLLNQRQRRKLKAQTR